MPQTYQVADFLKKRSTIPIVDVRSPSEFKRGHIPSAINVPLFDDEQRASVGVTYKQNGRETAILKGLDLIGPRLKTLARRLLAVVRTPTGSGNRMLMHCWRGGMRSQSMAWLAEQVGVEVGLLVGGYKAFRQHVLQSFAAPINAIVLSGLTGSGKTLALKRLAALGEQVIDLEGLANHRGSALGGIGLPEQPTVEHFENLLYDAIDRLNPERHVWFEDESRKIGAATIPNDLLQQIKSSPAIFLEVPRRVRTEIVLAEYGELPENEILKSINKIAKRMGGQNTKAACQAFRSGDKPTCVELLFDYYDKGYLNAKEKMPDRNFLSLATDSPYSDSTCQQLIELANREMVTGL